jgi:hypothetical protein
MILCVYVQRKIVIYMINVKSLRIYTKPYTLIVLHDPCCSLYVFYILSEDFKA